MRRTKKMSLLTKTTRSKYFKFLGLGEYNKANILKLQKKYFPASEQDGKYGKKTDYLLRHVYNVIKYSTNFKPEEFRCNCGRCTGYPVQMKAKTIKHVQTIRTHYGKPMTVTSGLRCKYKNDSVGGSKDSRHLEGRAVDFYIAGVTDTLPRRKNAIAYIKTLKNHRYTYGNGFNSYGQSIKAPNMGNALHTDTK